MKTALSVIVLSWVLCFNSTSQMLSPSVIATQGGFEYGAELTLEWTLGENFIETRGFSDNIITQGFHQPWLNSENEILQVLSPGSGFEILVSPNPVHSSLNVYLNSNENTELEIKLYDIYGNPVRGETTFARDVDVTIDVVDLPPGLFLLHISNLEGSIVRTLKILKIN